MLTSLTLSQLRSITPEDFPFLSALYADTRRAELISAGMPLAQQKFFLDSQFLLQHNYYQREFPSANFKIIELNNIAMGRIYYNQKNNNLHLIDIALLPEYQRKGIGNKLMQELMSLTAATKGKLILHVDCNNTIRHWYKRLGFKPIPCDVAFYEKLEWDSAGC